MPDKEITELFIDDICSIVVKELPDKSMELSINVFNSVEFQIIEQEAKRLNLTPEGYFKLLLLTGIGRKEIMEICDVHCIN